ncbi:MULTISPECIES: nuclear transport factor 2 family protein [Bradyrhizobium]|uniref:Polyketide cyclase n=1 Tax=Bradyrhizobium nanningense TaxID=1325118 RepID=A0A4Q0SBZ7_9BRAD|nr:MULTISPECIES: nuclear transport factor 2 family protein [Bradyrhizobium]RXH35852.1 polyketide cyclase [Bradyrhizobium nanningense]RXH36034.1 polyketide cyclase [Bradyrhizobium nanningense]TQF30792.1 polyketide cyclase [Bradyrhizobium sp. UNPA324]
MSSHHQPSTLAALGRAWVEAWNARDLERVLTLYDEAAVMTSDRIPMLGFDASGTVRGKDALRAYWGKALGLLPELHFTLIDLFVSPDSVVVFYANERARKICEYLRVNEKGLIVQGSANHLQEPRRMHGPDAAGPAPFEGR